MKEIVKKIKTFLAGRRQPEKKGRKSKGQSLVEIAIAFPVIIILLSGVVEFGFIINYYLSLLDATREAARFYSNLDPFNPDLSDNLTFYNGAADMVIDALEPRTSTDTTRKITMDPTRDDVVVTVLSIASNNTIIRYPTCCGYSGYFQKFYNQPTKLTDAEIQNRLVNGSPKTGVLIVEVFYGYHQVLNLPWLDPFLGDVTMLHAYTIMPLIAAEPQ